MRHLPGLLIRYKCVLVLTIAALVAFGAGETGAGRAYGQSGSQDHLAGQAAARSGRISARQAESLRGSAYAEYTIGVYLMESGAVFRAVDHLENAWRLSAWDVSVGRQLAKACFVLKNFARCEMVADNILTQVPDDYEALLLKAKVRYVKRDREGAVENLLRIREVHGQNFEIERLLGNIAYEAGDLELALEAYGKCLQIDDRHPYIYYRYGSLLVQAFRFSEAEAAFRRAIELDPGFVEPALDLAEIYVNTGRPNDAIPVLERAVSIDPSNNSALVELIQTYLETGRLDDGIRAIEQRASEAPLTRDLEILRGRLYYEAGEYGESFDVFKRLLDEGGDNPELARILGEISLRAGDAGQALRYFDMAIEMDPSDYRSYIGKYFAASPNFNDGDVLIDLSLEERVELLKESERLVKGHDFEGNYLLGISYLSMDSLEVAKRYLVRAVAVKPDDRGTLLNLASVFEKMEQYGEAERYLKQVYEQDPEDPSVCNFYGYLLAVMRKDLDKAETLILKALDSDPDNGYYLDSLGWVYYQMGDYSKAIAEIEKASLRVSDDPTILEHLGDAYRAMRRYKEARAAYERSSRLQHGNQEILEKIQSTTDEQE
ncbi:MAG: tetratricopeptide repeat protein [Candidatus Latescibacterota bacterium]|jgi:tetratricopeptide (TPR) repeat protein